MLSKALLSSISEIMFSSYATQAYYEVSDAQTRQKARGTVSVLNILIRDLTKARIKA